MRIFSEQEVEELLPMSAALAAVEASLAAQARGTAYNQPRRRLGTPAGAMLHAMEAAVEVAGQWYLGYKMYSTSRQGARFVIGLYDGATGEPLAQFAADRLGQRRTGAASGIATRLLAGAEAATAGLIGAGWQAESQLEAVCAVRPVRRARVFSRTAERRERFARAMSERLGIEVEPAATAAEAVGEAAIVITATNALQPVLPEAALAAGAHINAIGSNSPRRRELETATVLGSQRIVVDSIAQCLAEAGDLIQSLSGDRPWNRIEELASALAAGRGRRAANERTLFKSTGLAIWDVACAASIWRRAGGRS